MELIDTVVRATQSAHTARAYEQSLRRFLDWSEDQITRDLVRDYVIELRHLQKSPATINQFLAAVRKLAEVATDENLMPAAEATALAKIKGIRKRGRRLGRWLTPEEATRLLSAPDRETLKGKRDRVLLGLLLECGLRREEACALELRQVQVREKRTVLVDLEGKGGRTRTVPVPARLAERIHEWVKAADLGPGPVLRPVNKGGAVGEGGISPGAVYKTVSEYAEQLGLDIAPHDLRRSFGQLTFRSHAPLDQISRALGHSSLRTTEIYLGLDLDLHNAACDSLQLDDSKKDDDE